jgi:succinylarginine dihydrolase
MDVVEVNLDGLVGPTHHYAGLSTGNIASTTHAFSPANPAAAAHQGIAKMRFLHHLGLAQAVLPPHARPHLQLLTQLGFQGTPTQQLGAARRTAPTLLTACLSASSMWTANMATVSPSTDTADGRVHFTPANLVNQLHRHQEAAFSSRLLQKFFANDRYFKHHPMLPQTHTLSDEGAANHSRLCEHHGAQGLHLFVYGRQALGKQTTPTPSHFPARQTLEASEAIARNHRLDATQVVFAQQHPAAIDQGVFHHDVIGVANESLLLLHQDALLNQTQIISQLKQRAPYPLQVIEVSRDEFTLKDAVDSYVFNSQLLSMPSSHNKMILLAPKECEMHPRVKPWIDKLVHQNNTAITDVHYFDLKQSMQNGGGPACLRLRIPLNRLELAAMHQPILVCDTLLDTLDRWVDDHYRTELTVNDLADPSLMEESYRALDELSTILQLGSIYPFQH